MCHVVIYMFAFARTRVSSQHSARLSASFRLESTLAAAAMEQVIACIASLDKGMSLERRVEIVAPLLANAVEEFEAGTCKDGVETFQERLIQVLENSKLGEYRWVQVDNVGVHPDNRDGAGLVPVDVHDLLLHITKNGWSYNAVDALASEIPPGKIGDDWRKFNDDLAEAADGLLAASSAGLLEIVTGRGSHTTASVRLYKFGAKGVHDELCNDGVISQSKIIEMQPSMSQPITKGIRYFVVRWQVAVAIPGLMKVLSRTGNASHGVARMTTALQGCKRVHAIYTSLRKPGCDVDWDRVAKLASVGMPPNYVKDARMLCDFVQAWSGGADGTILAELESYERVLQVKRVIAASDLQLFSKLDLPDAPRYVLAMVKAILNAPATMVVNGVANVFTMSDINSLQGNGRNRKFAREANTIMQAASNFVAAYSRLPHADNMKITSDLEVRCVMHVHLKKVDTRASYASLLHIAKQMHDDLRAKDPRTPAWNLLAPLSGNSDDVSASSGLREVSLSGEIVDSQLADRGFAVGIVITSSETDDAIITNIDRMVGLRAAIAEEGDAGQSWEISRADLISTWNVKIVAETEVKQHIVIYQSTTSTLYDVFTRHPFLVFKQITYVCMHTLVIYVDTRFTMPTTQIRARTSTCSWIHGAAWSNQLCSPLSGRATTVMLQSSVCRSRTYLSTRLSKQARCSSWHCRTMSSLRMRSALVLRLARFSRTASASTRGT